ncbi:MULTISPECIES: CoA-binding protein [Deinococcus]|uniref:CoA-binding protein n=2 Tax=Deinococcus soli (ex Cha et al. 2016) TaxID=1309411 RepID=A0A0F7JNX9_9DEIO|nr:MULTISPECIES: CoA-binding protein [Deinococcus]AKH16330.1 CoA-binding protein [Deinococcus soli (ex Cha et al. 2016)]MDK2010797.1 CoA-binding protein [Deinococcus sp. 43]MDR6216771.1 putative CoA-binding protein [Deinococcus soli (ex Cha et al. 2016)]MDR6327592.1 putative CoA-binding protein [Deinococcus soli (ex Cha et al. 2016)]MDR6749867.1 putative CoA-binding protein [Deinococcus soli (ex Cha et al. 2016)]
MTLVTQTAQVRQILTEHKVIAVVGFHHDAMKPAYYVPEYMHRQGYTIIPVNPALAARGESYFGQKAVATLAEITTPVDIVDVFRRSDKVREHLPDILAMPTPPKVVWLQLGIRDDVTARDLAARGIDVVQDRCLLADHRALL